MKHFKKILLFTLIFSFANYAQVKVNIADAFKKTALSHMQAGRYGEAIDQLNKYITALPQDPEGYYLRGQCFEKRSQYEAARLDYRRAIALQNFDQAKKNKYERDLQNMLNVWYAILNKKIEGHLREIAINPNTPFNYLEIGKSYKLMEEWAKAEEWYDKYLERDDNASADEIIRYTEVLAKTGSITKGEKILKKYTDRYPQDWRLWSRYGYFTLWLGKYQIAKKAFETALSFKPFFKEAQDGLDLVNKQGYLNVNVGRDYEKEYPIDRYYRLLRRNPNDQETRFKLVDELIKAKRIEEAYDQLKILNISKSEDQRFKDKWNYVTAYRDSVYRAKIDEAKLILQKNEFDKEALKTVSNYYEYLQNYDSAMVMLDKYFDKYPDEKDKELRFRYAKISAWNREFDKAIDILDKLLLDDPNNLEYQLFRAQVSVWINRDLDIAEKFLDNVLKKQPNNLQAIISKASLILIKQDFEGAQELANKAKEIEPNNDDVIKLQSNIDWQKLRAEEEKLYAILEIGRQRVIDGDCSGAIQFYEEYQSKAEPNLLILKEYGDVLFCAKQYQKALDAYNQVLNAGANYQAQMQRAKLYYAMGDSLSAIKEFKDLIRQDSTDFEARLYLADSYAKAAEHDSARAIYNNLLENWKLDSTQVKMVELRKGWLPVSGIAAIIETFPNYLGFSPSVSYYADNLSFRLLTGGGRLDLGINNYLSAGVSFYRSLLKANAASLDQNIIDTIPNFRADQRFTTFKVHLFLKLSRIINIGIGLGKSNSLTMLNRDEQDAFFKIERRDTFAVTLQYQNSDAALILYSPYLLSIRNMARLYKFEGYYRNTFGLKIASMFQYIGVDDSNEGNNFYFRIGRYFYKDLVIGYEYAYDNFKWKSSYYYSPRNFESHSIWLDNEIDRKDNLRITLGGKLGIIPQSSLIILAGYFEGEYSPLKNLLITGRIGIGSTSRDNSSYRYFSGQLSAYWTIF
ncbi:tetratricopeptide repeat protein [Stygiobacter electus]|uniref:Tetratricopeptide repeat protein n=1 Tax=Stygiobacter electus TaxID=3032292 RepID=A0AAE3TCA7_9BACT|nr:tetratricopeptide repeat protein [Stygiobacter electus]MDF1612223.1 tetratricopeptide repeat protein [Stygiobacter electus]